jgi:hypothetical protein
MPLASLVSRCFLAVTVTGLVAVLGCGSSTPTVSSTPPTTVASPPPVSGEASVSSVQLTVGTQTISVSNNGTVTGGPIIITRPTAPTLTASFLNAGGSQDPLAHGGNFQLNATPGDGSILTFTRTSAFVGTLTGTAAGSTNLTVSLYHMSDGDNDFGPFPVPVTVK